MPDDPDALFPQGPTTRRGLLSAFSRRAAEALPVPDVPEPPAEPDFAEEDFFHEEPHEQIEPFLAGDDLIAEIRASVDETGMHVWWLGQSGFVVQVMGENLLIDPYLSDTLSERHAGADTPYERLSDIAVDPALLSFVNVVLCSNAHLDHLDPGTLPHVLAGGATFVCAAGLEILAAERAGRVPDAKLEVGEDTVIGGWTITAVPAYHPDDPEAVGFVIRNGVYAVYHAGDSQRVQGMAEAVAHHGVDLAFVPINGRNGNMDGTDAARLAYETGTQIAVACHHEMFRNDTASTSRFVAECVRLRVEYRLPRVGERITIDYGY